MQTTNIKFLLSLFVITLIGCNFLGFINPNFTTFSVIYTSVTHLLSIESLATGGILLFLIPFLIPLLFFNYKIFLTYGISSTIINILVGVIFQEKLSTDLLLYSINLASLSIIVGFILYIRQEQDKDKIKDFYYFLFAGFLSRGFSLLVSPGINFAIATVPYSYDMQAIYIDSFLGVAHAKDHYLYFINDYLNINGFFFNLLNIVYHLLSVFIMIMVAMEYKQRHKRFHVNTLFVSSVASVIGIFLYYLYPVMGPGYFQIEMKNAIPNNWDWHNHLGTILNGSIFARNGMPSLHILFALFMFLNTRKSHIVVRGVFFIVLILTALATLVLGEHYLIDWIMSPSLLMIVMCLSTFKLRDKCNIIIANTIFIVVWYLFLWFGVDVLHNIYQCANCERYNISMSVTLYSFIVVAIGLFIFSYKNFYAIADAQIKDEQVVNILDIIQRSVRSFKYPNIITILFTLSGFAALIYQVSFGKILGTTFGTTSIAIYSVLASYMIGLAMGAFLASRENSRVNAILKYAFCEISVGIYCLLSPLIFKIIHIIYINIAPSFISHYPIILTIQIILSVIILIIPTILMGATMPILLKHLNNEKKGVSIGYLYFLNTLGAALGALLSGYWLIEGLGVTNTIFLAVAINFIIGIQAIKSYKSIYKIENIYDDLQANLLLFLDGVRASVKINKISFENISHDIKLPTLFLFFSGIITMCLETLFMNSLAIVVGNSTYAFSIMLFTFLLGLSMGANMSRQFLGQLKNNYVVIGLSAISLALSLIMSLSVLGLTPKYLAAFANSTFIQTFQQQEFIKSMICICIMIIPTIIIGFMYPVMMNALNDEKEINVAIAINTVGNIIGIFVGGFLLINHAGLIQSFKLIVIALLIFSLIALYKPRKIKYMIMNIILLIIIICVNFSLNMDNITNGANVYFMAQGRGHVIDYAQSIDGGLTSVNEINVNNKKELTLLTNGKFQGDNTNEMYAQGGFAIAPILHTTNKNNALVIGYGTGMTTRVIHDANFKHLDVVDISPDILHLADKYFNNINDHVRENKNVVTHINDGRNYLELTTQKYDLISLEISSIWFAGESYLYNKEFYQIAKSKLNDDGMLQQWVQLHHMAPKDFFIILNTVRSEFKYVNFYIIGGQGIIVATNNIKNSNPMDKNMIDLNHNEKLNQIKAFYKNDFTAVENMRVLNATQTDKVLDKIYHGSNHLFYSTDNNLYLEYNTPKSNSIKTNTTTEIIKMIKDNES